MQTMNVSLPDAMKHFIDAQVTAGGYSSVREYIRTLVRDEQQRQAKARLEALLLEALDSGEPTAMTQEDWDAIRREGWENAPYARSWRCEASPPPNIGQNDTRPHTPGFCQS